VVGRDAFSIFSTIILLTIHFLFCLSNHRPNYFGHRQEKDLDAYCLSVAVLSDTWRLSLVLASANSPLELHATHLSLSLTMLSLEVIRLNAEAALPLRRNLRVLLLWVIHTTMECL